jgi:hypothetical protein
MLSRKVVVGVDVGNIISGVVVLMDGEIHYVKSVHNCEVMVIISKYFGEYSETMAVIEDIKPYAGNLSQQAIDTCKFIGQITWRLDEDKIPYKMVTRSEVRKFVYDILPEMVIPMVNARITQRNEKNNDGKNRRPSFVYVNDAIVLKAMKVLWRIETPPPGKGYIHGLKSHTWSGLALASYFSYLTPTFASLLPHTFEQQSFYVQPAS